MKPAPFKYIAASSLDHALSLKAEYGDDARFLAGGQSLMPAMNFRLSQPSVLIDVNPLDECVGIARSEGGEIHVGALTRYRELERADDFLRLCPLFADALPHIAHPQIRNRGTIGGNLAHADPASELPAIAVAMGARMRVRSLTGDREIAASAFFIGLLTTDIGAHEMLVDIVFPSPRPRSGACFMEIARRRGDFALAGVAATVTLDEEQRCTDVRLALCGVGETPVDASHAASGLMGRRCSSEAIDAVASEVGNSIAPSGNVHASPDYQRHIAVVLTKRALDTAHSRVGHGT
jgi:6-hydroxypseudooxynicotine dehydrogenase subunit alpha